MLKSAESQIARSKREHHAKTGALAKRAKNSLQECALKNMLVIERKFKILKIHWHLIGVLNLQEHTEIIIFVIAKNATLLDSK